MRSASLSQREEMRRLRRYRRAQRWYLNLAGVALAVYAFVQETLVEGKSDVIAPVLVKVFAAAIALGFSARAGFCLAEHLRYSKRL